MYLLSRKVKAMGVKMVLSGEGSDEIFGGLYLNYLHVVCRFSPNVIFSVPKVIYISTPPQIKNPSTRNAFVESKTYTQLTA